MLSLKKDKKEEEEKDGGNPYTNLEKTSVLQEARYILVPRAESFYLFVKGECVTKLRRVIFAYRYQFGYRHCFDPLWMQLYYDTANTGNGTHTSGQYRISHLLS